MLKALTGVGILVAALAGGWLGSESWASDKAARLIAEDPALEAAEVRPLRDPRAIGVEMIEPQLRIAGGFLSLPWARLSLSPLSPLTTRLDMPARGQLILCGQTRTLDFEGARASLHVAPLNQMATDRLGVAADRILLDDVLLIEGLEADARLVRLDADAPLAARVAYDAVLALEALHVPVLAPTGVSADDFPGPVTANGQLRLWLDRTPSVTGDTAPALVAWQTKGLTLGAGPLTVRIVGRVARDSQGRAEGQVAVYSGDAEAMLDAAAALGLIPGQADMLLRAGLSQLSQAAMDADLPGPDFPEPAEGELRLPVLLEEGQVILGGVPLGPAPMF